MAAISSIVKFMGKINLLQNIRKPGYRKNQNIAPKSLDKNERNRVLRDKVYDYSKAFSFEQNKYYIISGKINSANKMYLILENAKEDKKYSNIKVQKTMTG